MRRIGWVGVLIAAVAIATHLWGETRVGLVDRVGHPFGDDALNFWAGARVALEGHPGTAYDMPAFHAFEQAAIDGAIQLYHYSYPPTTMLVTAPLGALPFLSFWAVWVGGGSVLFALCVRLWLSTDWLLYAAALPAVTVNAISGQIGCWIAVIFATALMLLPAQPLVAGLVFSLALIKPQLAWLVPFALLAGRSWRALAGFAAGSALLLAGSVAAFGVGIWASYGRQVGLLRTWILENGEGVWHRFLSAFVLVRHAGASVAVAEGVQAVVSLAMLGLVVAVWRDAAGAPARRNAVLVLASVLASPYVSDYDLVVAALVPLWLLAWSRRTSAWVAAALVIVAPLLAAPLALATGFAVAGLLLVPALVCAVRLPS